MPDTETHIKVGRHLGGWGGVMTAAYHFLGPRAIPLLKGLSYWQLPIYALTVWVATRLGSRLPDLIEPPTDPDHRGLFHSFLTYLLTLGKVLWLWLWTVPGASGPVWTFGRIFLAFLGMSYLAHLHLDAQTADSIPWVT